MILDSHIHLFRNGYFGDAGTRYLGGQTDLSAYRALAKTHGISGALVICYEADGIDPTNNAYLREIAPAEPWITSLAFLPADTPPSLAELSQHLRAGHAGFALYLPDAAAGARLAAWPEEVWTLLSDAQAILSLNARPAAIEALGPTLAAYPGLRILFSHLGLPGPAEGADKAKVAERLAPLLALAPCPHVAIKLSGLYAIDPAPGHPGATPFAEVLFDAFGPDRLCWGSDFSPVLEFSDFVQALELDFLAQIDATARKVILGGALGKFLSSRTYPRN